MTQASASDTVSAPPPAQAGPFTPLPRVHGRASWLHHPRNLWLRRALFQVHLWLGVLCAVYIALIALSGTLLIFKEDLLRLALPPTLHRTSVTPLGVLAQATEQFRRAYPHGSLSYLESATPGRPVLLLDAVVSGQSVHLIFDPVTGALIPLQDRWLEFVERFHVYLLLPERFGVQVNGAGAAALLLLTATGLPLWWSGLRTWTRGLRVRFRANWRRTNYDLHLAIGFWTMALISWWAFSGFYFGFSQVTTRMLNVVAPIRAMREPPELPATNSSTRLPLRTLLEIAQHSSPSSYMMYVGDPLLGKPTTAVTLDRGAPGDFSKADIVTIDNATGRVLRLWHYGERRSSGDWILFLIYPLHFGTLWGPACKLLYSVAGLGLAVLSLSGLLMYWNRFLRLKTRSFLPQPAKRPAIWSEPTVPATSMVPESGSGSGRLPT